MNYYQILNHNLDLFFVNQVDIRVSKLKVALYAYYNIT